MKKPILFLLLFFAHFLNAQDFWTVASAFPDAVFSQMHISTVSDQVIWANGYNASETANASKTWYRSVDGGSSWAQGDIDLGSDNLYINSICGISETTAYASANSNSSAISGGVWVTFDSGISWTRQSPEFGLNTFGNFDNFIHDNFVYFWNPENGVVVSNPENNHFVIYTTNDSGNSWTRTIEANLPIALQDEKGLLVKFGKTENSVWFGTTKGRIFKSDDKGIHWNVSEMPPEFSGMPNTLSAVAFKNDLEGMLVTDSYRPYATTDNGNHWDFSNVLSGAPKDGQVVFVPQTASTYFSWGQDLIDLFRGTSYTTDNGASWTDLGTTDQNPVTIITAEFLNYEIGFCVGYYQNDPPQGIFFFKLGENSFRRLLNTKSFASEDKILASPNPASDVMAFSGKNIQSVTVFDFTEKKVAIQNFRVADNVLLDVSKLQSGIYLAEVTTDSGTSSTIKILKN